MVSLSVRSIDYLIANKELQFRKIGTRTMIPVSELQRRFPFSIPELRTGRLNRGLALNRFGKILASVSGWAVIGSEHLIRPVE